MSPLETLVMLARRRSATTDDAYRQFHDILAAELKYAESRELRLVLDALEADQQQAIVTMSLVGAELQRRAQ